MLSEEHIMSIKRLLKTKKCQKFLTYIKEIGDDRQQWKIKHKQYSIIFIIILAILAGCNKFKEYYVFACKYQNRLSKLVDLEHGIPSHDTMERAIHRIKSIEFNALIIKFVSQYIPDRYLHICIDGKFVKATREGINSIDAIDIVSAYVAGVKLSIHSEQTRTNTNTKNEIGVMKQLLIKLHEILPNTRMVITIDAMAAVNPILSLIVSFGWDYIICIKSHGNKKNWGMYEKIVDEFNAYDNLVPYVTKCKENGRNEIRKYYVVNDVSNIEGIEKWNTIKAIGKVESKTINNKTSEVTDAKRYFLLSRQFTNKMFGDYQREHWEIESSNYILDNSFNEDHMRMKKGSSTLNLNLLRKFVMNVINLHVANVHHSSITSFRDTCKLLASPQELLYIILNPLNSPKNYVI